VAGRTYITPEMLDARARCYEHAESLPISASDIRRWAIAVYHPEVPPRLFWDEAYARRTVHGGIVAPEEFNPFAWITRDGPARRPPDAPRGGFIERGLGIAPPALRHDLFGGVEIEYAGARMRPGDVIRSSSVLVDYWEREGSLGLMLFTAVEVRWTLEDESIRVARNVYIRY
jgi:hypothetical protein